MDSPGGEPATSWEPVFSGAGLGQAVRPPRHFDCSGPEKGEELETAIFIVPGSQSGPDALKKAVEEYYSEKSRSRENVRVAITEVGDASSWSVMTVGERDDLHLAPAEEETPEGEDGLSHHGDPGTEVEVVEDLGSGEAGVQRVLRAQNPYSSRDRRSPGYASSPC